jgi:Fe-S cluster assembly ATP-binding protein|uniref:Sulfate ABC transporter protein n=1 Tax=Teleaulax amphioxeia TaxID=77931 RepID=A0A0H4SP69_9CRYP|nr:sulfate ABC transporter protein [Teleaulax amphioxeia]AKP94638.1 sulfate ABC transporter protein [Teleaulax amphioxeia]|tara:strand:- start:1512 stop:2267 length:756 start_codon:yes stop_codon:yes gene_type:complete
MVKNSPILEIQGLKASVNDTAVIKDLNLTVNPGEIHAIMGKNGSGKSTFSKIVAGHSAYRVTAGNILFNGESILEVEPEERSQKGIFLGFQYPIEIPGVSNADFLRLSCNARRKYQGLDELDPLEFFEFITQKLDVIEMDPSFLNRSVNEGFSGGEKKRNEILQMAVLDTKLAILDETDSGLDIDALKIVSKGINSLANDSNAVILITHYQRLLDYIEPTFIHVMQDGKIIKTGDKSLAKELESKGYDWLK